jgi:hypothetical protein
MVGGALIHLKSLRSMEDDEGWIRQLLDEAENERMHLIWKLKPDARLRDVILVVRDDEAGHRDLNPTSAISVAPPLCRVAPCGLTRPTGVASNRLKPPTICNPTKTAPRTFRPA